MNPPNELNLAGKKPYCWDTETLIENFLGKTKSQAIQMYRDKWVSEDFSYMREEGLIYYCEAALDYLQSSESEEDEWDFASGLLCSLYCQVTISKVGKGPLRIMKTIANYIDENRGKFDIEYDEELTSKYISVICNA